MAASPPKFSSTDSTLPTTNIAHAHTHTHTHTHPHPHPHTHCPTTAPQGNVTTEVYIHAPTSNGLCTIAKASLGLVPGQSCSVSAEGMPLLGFR